MLGRESQAYGLKRVEPAYFSGGLDVSVRKREGSMMIFSVSNWKGRVATSCNGKVRASRGFSLLCER